MEGKYAIALSATKGYMPGLNGILNALESYGMRITPIVYSPEGDISDTYRSKWPNVRFLPVDNAWVSGKHAKVYIKLAPYRGAMELLDEFDAVAIWGADVCPVNNFIDYFDISRLLGKVVLGSNELVMTSTEELQEVEPYPHHWRVPYADIPVIVSRCHRNVLERFVDLVCKSSNGLSVMDGLNYAVRDSGAKVFEVPGNLWIHKDTNDPVRIKNGCVPELYSLHHRMFSFHNRYWNKENTHKYFVKHENPYRKANMKLFNTVWVYFNMQCRVKLEDGVSKYV